MSETAMNAARMIDMLPDSDQHLAYELIKKLVLAWDPDFTKLTPEEAKLLNEAENDEFVDAEDIDWSQIGAKVTSDKAKTEAPEKKIRQRNR